MILDECLTLKLFYGKNITMHVKGEEQKKVGHDKNRNKENALIPICELYCAYVTKANY